MTNIPMQQWLEQASKAIEEGDDEKIAPFLERCLHEDTLKDNKRLGILTKLVTGSESRQQALLDSGLLEKLFSDTKPTDGIALLSKLIQINSPKLLHGIRELNLDQMAPFLYKSVYFDKDGVEHECLQNKIEVMAVLIVLLFDDGIQPEPSEPEILNKLLKHGIIEAVIVVGPNSVEAMSIFLDQLPVIWKEANKRMNYALESRADPTTPIRVVDIVTQCKGFSLDLAKSLVISDPGQDLVSPLVPIMLANLMVNSKRTSDILDHWPWALEATIKRIATPWPKNDIYPGKWEYLRSAIFILRVTWYKDHIGKFVNNRMYHTNAKEFWHPFVVDRVPRDKTGDDHWTPIGLEIIGNILEEQHDAAAVDALLQCRHDDSEPYCTDPIEPLVVTLAQAARTLKNTSKEEQAIAANWLDYLLTARIEDIPEDLREWGEEGLDIFRSSGVSIETNFNLK